jgi:hypothetical protein
MKTILFFLLISLISFSALAMHEPGAGEEAHKHNQENNKFSLESLNIGSGDVAIEVHGMVCSFCAQGIRKKLSKLDFINSKKYNKGTIINIENQTILIALKAKIKPNLHLIFKSIRSSGYNPVMAYFLNKDNKIISFNPND